MTVGLTLSEVTSFKAELVSLLEQLRSEIVEEVERSADLQQESMTVHDSSEEADAEVNFMLKVESLSRHSEEIAECLAALERINQGGFGICTDCDEEVELSRLKACPTAARCIRCQSAHEGLIKKSA
ncbi:MULTISPECIES: TraR/DksA family transcriptional regulator [unclassified Neptuniibacter]|uniref:TraR/DksA family transcriptional regulator n=1 Tax=unclassified Neptuniibacter TaxID=2630693 RepID=UPI0025F0C3FC|nr:MULTISPECIES: TraR/DksA family transcriptional regulator [unclassified Neptuniibacter]